METTNEVGLNGMKGESSLCISGATHRSSSSYSRKAMLIDIDVVVIKCALALETGISLIRKRKCSLERDHNGNATTLPAAARNLVYGRQEGL